MATVNKNFKVKHGLVVEGTTGTINGEDILTKAQADQDYIIDLIGGSATPENTPDTVVLRDGNGDFAANDITVNEISIGENGRIYEDDGDTIIANTDGQDVTINAEDIRLNSTDDIRLNATGDVIISSSTGEIRFEDGPVHIGYPATAENEVATKEYVTGAISDIDLTFNSDEITEGSTNLYFTDARAKDVVDDSIGQGLSLNQDTQKIDVNTIPAGGSTADSGLIVYSGTGPNAVSFVSVDRAIVDGWYDAAGAAGDVASDLTDHENLSSGVHGVTGSVVGTTDTQDISNKKIIDTLYFSDGVTIAEEGEIAVRAGSHDFDIQANYGDLHLKTVHTDGTTGSDVQITSMYGDILLSTDGSLGKKAYYGTASAENEIATHGYVDNAISGLDWKQAVHLLYDAAIPVLSGSGATQLIVDGHDVLGDADSGYRLLLTGATSPGIYVYNSTAGSWTLTRAEDADAFGELVGAAVYVMEGTQYGSTSWVQGNHYLTDFTGQSWTQFSGQGSVTAGDGITVDGLEVSINRTTVDDWYEAAGAVSTHSDLTTGVHGVSGDVVGTSDTQILSNKTIKGYTAITDTSDLYLGSIGDNDGDLAIGGENNLILYSSVEDIIFAPSTGRKVYVDSASAGNEVATKSYVDDQDTDDVAEGSTNLYFTNQRALDATASAYDATGTAQGIVDALDTDDIEEGSTNQYFTTARANSATVNLLTSTNVNLTNISITANAFDGVDIVAENGVADSDTDDLTEGTTNLYFTNTRAVDALEAVVPNFTAVEVNSVAKQVASTMSAASAGTHVGYAFAKADYRSAEFLVKVAYGDHTEISKVLLTLDINDNIAITEYGIIGTNGSGMTVTAGINGANVQLLVTTANNTSTVKVVGTLLA
jgi:hypothetical protein